MDLEQCPICVENYNNAIKKAVVCPKTECGFTACKECVRRYVMETTTDPCCMNCNYKLSYNFCILNLNKSFMNGDYSKHRKQLLLDRELSKMPETMHIAEQYKTIRGIDQETSELKDDIRGLNKIIHAKRILIAENENNITQIKSGGKKEKAKFIMQCPDEECRGYLSTAYKCGICKKYTCPKCIEIIGENKNTDHQCDEDKVASAELIKNTSKACPGCGERIMKLDGCDQMWCTTCHTAFSWKTGVIDMGVVHNPHYYQYQQNNTDAIMRNPNDIHCGGLVNWFQLSRKLRAFSLYLVGSEAMMVDTYIIWLRDLHRVVADITYDKLVRSRQKLLELEDFKQDRVNYILKFVSKEELSSTILRKDKTRRKYKEMEHIFEILSTVGIDTFARINSAIGDFNQALVWKSLWHMGDHKIQVGEEFEKVLTPQWLIKEIELSFEEYKKLIVYCNNEMKKISAVYSQCVTIIDIDGEYPWIDSRKYRLTDIEPI